MPTGYRGEGKTFSKKLGKWLKKETQKAFDYDSFSEEDRRTWALIISFFRFYPDYFYDMIRSENARYKLELPQRMMLRIWARYRNTYITGGRGITKSYTLQLSKDHDGIFYPGEKIRYVAPAQKQSAKIASDAFKTVEENYPLLASWWNRNSDRPDMFRITTVYGSEFTMYAPRGDNCGAIVGEEIAQEGADGFDIPAFESDVSPTCRLTRKIHGTTDRTHINLKETYISNASSRQNRAYTVYRFNALKDMIHGDKYDGYCLDMPWTVALLCNLRDVAYYKKERKKLTAEAWLREMGVLYTGNGESPVVTDAVLARSKKLMLAEFEHCGDPDAIYIVSHDVSYVDGRKTAKCADVVLKLVESPNVHKRDKFIAKVVFVDNYAPPKTASLQAQKLKDLWRRFCKNGCGATYLLVDAQAYGTEIVENLMKPANDGLPPLCCYEHMMCADIEQPGAIPVIYPMKANARGSLDPDTDMIVYAQAEFEQGNVELLTGSVLDGVEAYKNTHGIKDIFSEAAISQPYKMSELLCQQIANLQLVLSGASLKEKRKSKAIQRDIWSALKYALRLKEKLEKKMLRRKYRAESSWKKIIEEGAASSFGETSGSGGRSSLIGLRKIR